MGERDPLVASFWKVVFNDTDWLIQRIKTIRVTLRNWRHYRSKAFQSDRDRARACLFLNRTSFSGILADTAGPIGGHAGKSDYTIDCRFTRETLIKRIEQIAEFRDRVEFVNAGCWRKTIAKAKSLAYLGADDVFYYLDPPFYAKADRLYRYAFDDKEHKALRNAVKRLKSPWLVSYDPAVEIIKMYTEHVDGSITHLDLLYSAASATFPNHTREVVITNLPKLPRETRLWRSSREWRRSAARIAKAS